MFNFINECDIDKYSLFVAAGDDICSHYIINGMLMRKDGKKLPLAMIPNGVGNDLCNSFQLSQLEDALDAIVGR